MTIWTVLAGVALVSGLLLMLAVALCQAAARADEENECSHCPAEDLGSEPYPPAAEVWWRIVSLDTGDQLWSGADEDDAFAAFERLPGRTQIDQRCEHGSRWYGVAYTEADA